MNTTTSRLILAGCMCFALFAGPAEAITKKVDCDNGQLLQDALVTAIGSADTLEITVRGTCNEFITIGRDRVAIEGEDGAMLIGQIRIFGPSNVTIRNLTITGPGNGVVAFGGRTRLIDLIITQNEGFGVIARDGAAVRINRGEITDSIDAAGVLVEGASASLSNVRVAGNGGSGVVARQNSRLVVEGGQVQDNFIGIEVNDSSSLTMFDTEVMWNREFGVLVFGNSSASITGAAIEGNGRQGIELGFNSSAYVVEGSASANGENGIYAAFHSMVAVVGTTIHENGHNGLVLVNDSGAFLYDETHIPENGSGFALVCVGDESSFELQPPATLGQFACNHPQF